MSSTTGYRVSGVVLLVGSLLTVLFVVIRLVALEANQPDPVTGPQSPLWLPVNLMILIGSMLLLAGLPGMYARQATRSGWLGLVGFVLTFLAVLMIGVVRMSLDTFAIPFLATHAPGLLHWDPLVPGADLPALHGFSLVANLLLIAGTILLGSATIRAGVFSSEAGGALITAGLLNLVNLVPWFVILSLLPGIPFFVGLVWFGYKLVSLPEVKGEQGAAQV